MITKEEMMDMLEQFINEFKNRNVEPIYKDSAYFALSRIDDIDCLEHKVLNIEFRKIKNNVVNREKTQRKISKFMAEKFIEKLLENGAEFKTEGVYRLGRFDFYPRKGNARDYKTNEYLTQEDALDEILKGE